MYYAYSTNPSLFGDRGHKDGESGADRPSLVHFARSQVAISYCGVQNPQRHLDHFRRHHQHGESWAVVSREQMDFRLAFFDMDGTLISQESSVEMADRYLSKELHDEVARITSQSMAGEISFKTNLLTKMKMFENTNKSMLEEVTAACTLSPGAKELCEMLHQASVTTYLVTGGLKTMAASFAQVLGMAGFCANTEKWINRSTDLDHPDWVMSGDLVPPIIDGMEKARFVEDTSKKHRCSPKDTLVVGDGANDIDMARIAGLAVGFSAKRSLRPHIHVANETGHHLFLIDLIEHVHHLEGTPKPPTAESQP